MSRHLPPGTVLEEDFVGISDPQSRKGQIPPLPPGTTLEGEAPEPVAPERGLGSQLLDVPLAAAQGITGGYMDEIGAALKTAINKRPYEENLAATRARYEEIPTAVGIPSEIAGGVGTMFAAAPVLAGTKIAQVFARLPPWLRSTGLGSLIGGIFGSGYAEGGLEDRAMGGLVGAGVGAATGGAAHGIIRGIQAGGGKIAQGVRTIRDPEGAAMRKTAEAFNLDETTAARGAARLKSLGRQGMIADVGGENVLGLARGTAGVPGPAKNRIMMALEGRAGGEAERIGQGLRKGLKPQDYFAAEEVMLGKLQAPAAEAYQAAYQANSSVMTKTLERYLKRPVMKKVLKQAVDLAGIESSRVGPLSKELGDMARYAAEVGRMKPVKGGVARGFKLETWDNMKRGIDALIDKQTNPITGRLTNKGRLLGNLKRDLVKELDRATGGTKSLYAKARKQYAGDIEVLNSLRDGRKFMKMDAERITQKLNGLSDAGKEAYRSGAARAVMDVVEGTADQASAARRLFGKSITRKKISAIFPTKGDTTGFARRMVAEQRFAKTKNYIGSGSRTAPMLAEQDALSRMAGNIGAVTGSEIPGGGHALVKAGIGRRIMQRMVPPSQEANRALARILTGRNQAENQRILEELAKMGVGGPPSGGVNPLTAGIIAALAQQGGRVAGQIQ